MDEGILNSMYRDLAALLKEHADTERELQEMRAQISDLRLRVGIIESVEVSQECL